MILFLAKMVVRFSAVGNEWARIKQKTMTDKPFVRQLLKCKM
jgi:hypothetical protein